MILRLSRVTEQMEKSADVVDFALRHPKGTALTATALALAAPQLRQDISRAKMGLTKEWLEAQDAGLVPSMPPEQTQYTSFNRPARIARLLGL